jgi:pimeloyl-ACP methyl ester carboxylesterase
LAELVRLVWKAILPRPVFLVVASMGGLIGLLMIRRYGTAGLQGLINIEGNLASEDCMFSRRVTSHTLDELSQSVFRQIQSELRTSGYPGDHMIAHNMALNTDVRAYFQCSFETVRESDSGRLLDEFIGLPLPRLFLYGEANRSLSYIPKLHASNVEVCAIPQSAHFLFYDNPVQTFEEVGRFVDRTISAGSK